MAIAMGTAMAMGMGKRDKGKGKRDKGNGKR